MYPNLSYNDNHVQSIFILKNNYISCLLNMPKHKLLLGIKEIKEGYGQTIIFNDKLICLTYKN